MPIRRGTTVAITIQRIKIPELTAGFPGVGFEEKGTSKLHLNRNDVCRNAGADPFQLRRFGMKSELFDLALCQLSPAIQVLSYHNPIRDNAVSVGVQMTSVTGIQPW